MIEFLHGCNPVPGIVNLPTISTQHRVRSTLTYKMYCTDLFDMVEKYATEYNTEGVPEVSGP